MQNPNQYRGLLFLSLLAALLCDLLPIPLSWAWYLPDWSMIWVLIWTLIAPRMLGLTQIFFFGLFVDVLLGGVIGAHAMSYVLIGCVAFHVRLPFKFYPLWQQFVLFGFFGLMNTQILYWINSLVGREPLDWQYWGQGLSGAFFWLIFVGLRALRARNVGHQLN